MGGEQSGGLGSENAQSKSQDEKQFNRETYRFPKALLTSQRPRKDSSVEVMVGVKRWEGIKIHLHIQSFSLG